MRVRVAVAFVVDANVGAHTGVYEILFDEPYEALHTTGTNYIVEDIDLFIEARQPVSSTI